MPEKRKLFLGLDIQTLIILVLVIIIVMQRCGKSGITTSGGPSITKRDTVIVRDTQWITKTETVYEKPKMSAPPRVDTSWRDTLRLKDDSYAYLLARYMELGDRHFTYKYYEQSFNLDTFGSATIRDTLYGNGITGRRFSYNFKYPQITTTVTVEQPYQPRRQVYVGGSLWGNQSTPISGINAGLLYKDRKDRIFGINAGVMNNQVLYGVSSYWKIKIK